MAKPVQPVAANKSGASSRKILISVIAAVVLLTSGGAAAFLLLNRGHNEAAVEGKNAADEKDEGAAHDKIPAKFVDLGTFTANLVREENDQFLQVAISLKLAKPELEEKVKANTPEILHRVNMVLQTKRPSELATYENKEQLARQIKAQVEYVMGYRKTPPAIGAGQPDTDQTEPPVKKGSISEVLFTSFIIQ